MLWRVVWTAARSSTARSCRASSRTCSKGRWTQTGKRRPCASTSPAPIALAKLLKDYETRLLLSPGYRANAATMAVRWEIDLAGPLPGAQDRGSDTFSAPLSCDGRDPEAITLLLEEALAHARATQKRLEELELLALSAWQQLDLYDLRIATQTLTQAEALARETGYVRVLLDIPESSGCPGAVGFDAQQQQEPARGSLAYCGSATCP